jgi:uncharacterized membrane protein HdeD (DUF308 family)
MTLLLASSWWSLGIRGVVAVLVGLVALAWPGIALSALVVLFGAYALIDGLTAFVGAWRARDAHEKWGALLIEGIAGVGAAVITVMWPLITVLALVYIVAGWALITGVLELGAAVRLRKHISGEWMLALSGVVSVVFGGVLAIFPVAGALTLAIWFGVYSLIFGALLVGLGIRLRGMRTVGADSTEAPAWGSDIAGRAQPGDRQIG